MASPHLSLSDDQPHHHLWTPLDLSFPTEHSPPPAHTSTFLDSLPPSPTLIAAATTLAALSDDRPPTISEEHEDVDLDDDDDDHSGGISITPFDLQPYSVDMPLQEPTALPADLPEQQSQDVAEQLQMAMLAQLPSSTLPWPSALIQYNNNISPHPSMLSYIHANHPQLPTEEVYSYSSSYEQTLEPPPTLQEAHLSIQDKASFAPITSFFHYLDPRKRVVPGLDLIEVPESITRDDLQGDRYDWQGIDWAARDITRAYVRSNRFAYETTKLPRSLQQVRKHISPTPNKDSFFQFKRNNTRCRAFFPHFQLRNVLAVNSRNDIMYAYGHRIYRTDADGASPSVLLDLGKRLTPDGSITTMASQTDVLIAGAFEGEYAIVDLKSEYGSHCAFGRATDYAPDTKSRISNHMHLFESRTTYVPHAVLCSNDERLRVLDCVTNQFIHSFPYSAAVNSAATSPDGRMRVLVGDFQETLITNAETGQAFETLNSHTDDGFACAWADDGIHVATAAQDSTIVVWDARNWSKPLNVMISELSIPRSLHFSPIGSGPRVLVAAEADDYVNIINAQTFESKQLFDFFGPIGGVSFTPDGQSLFIANSERRFGGIIELDRTHWKGRSPKSRPLDDTIWEEQMTDWAPESELSSHDRVMSSDVERERRDLDLAFFV